MPLRLLGISASLLLWATAPSPLQGQATPTEDLSDSAQHFVQEFYDWYIPGLLKSFGTKKSFSWQERASDFDQRLFRALKEDDDAQAKVPGEIVGLDWDPFVANQDPCEHNTTRKVRKNGEVYLVDVLNLCNGQEDEKVHVVAEVVRQNGHWVFVNFRYPAEKSGEKDSDPMTILKALHEDRQKRSK